MAKDEVDQPLAAIGFSVEELSSERVSGRMEVTDRCCQPFKVLHGGVSALIAESLASMGAHVASGYSRVAGIHLSIHHVRPAEIGESITAEARPMSKGRNVHVWEVSIRKCKSKDKTVITDSDGNLGQQQQQQQVLVSSSRVTLLCNLPSSPGASLAAAQPLLNHIHHNPNINGSSKL